MTGSPPSSSSSTSHNNTSVRLRPDGYATRKPRFARRRKTTAVDEGASDAIDEERRRESPCSISFLCGIAAGVLQAGLFNPFDRALYLSVINQAPFLRAEHFQNPYSGFMQSVGHRALSSGLYYPLENAFCSLLLSPDSDPGGYNECADQRCRSATIHLHPAFANFLAGTLAGSANALIVNPIAAIKYKSWGRELNRGMVRESTEMFRKGGLRPFGNGLVPTVLRDLCFGGTYTFLRLELQYFFRLRPEQQWGANMAAAAMATIVSAPFNLVRNVQYATRSREKADAISKILRDFAKEVARRDTAWQGARYVQHRLRIGWGTARVAVGMAFGHLVYDSLMGLYEDFDDRRTSERRRAERQRSPENDDNSL